MNRREALEATLKAGVCCAALAAMPREAAAECTQDLEKATKQKDFIANWLNDLLDAMEKDLDRDTHAKMIGACGTACFQRHDFKRQIAAKGKGDVDKLIEAYHENFEAWKEGNSVHIRFGEVSKICYCPVARTRPAKANDMHCECTRGTHAAIFREAFGREIPVEIVETVRRGGKTCHFIARL